MAEFNNRKDLERWLKDRPREDAVVLATRAALRVLPLLVTALDESTEASSAVVVLPVFRASAAAWVAAIGPTQGEAVRKAARAAAAAPTVAVPAADAAADAADAADADDAADAAHAAAHAVDAAADAIAAADVAAHSARVMALRGYAFAGSSAAATAARAWNVVSADATALEQGQSPELVVGTPLWPETPPAWAADAWARLEDHLLKADEGWRVWTKWYGHRLHGRSFDKALEEARVLIPEEIWKQGPKAVNAEIKRLIEKHTVAAAVGTASGTGTADAVGEAINLPAKLDAALTSGALRSAIADFTFDELAQLMRMVPFAGEIPELDDPVSARERAHQLSELADGMTDLAEDIEAAGKNVPPALKNNLRRYSAEAGRGPADVRPGRLWDLGERLHDAMLDEDIRFGLDTLLTSALESMVDKHLNLMRVYFAAALARMRNLDQIELAPDATPDALVDALDATAKAIETADWGDTPPPEEAIPEDFADRVTELRAIQAAAERAKDPATVESLRKRLEQKAKGAAVTVLRFGVRTAEAGYKGGKIAVGSVKELGGFAGGGFAIYEAYKLLPPLVAEALDALKNLLLILLP